MKTHKLIVDIYIGKFWHDCAHVKVNEPVTCDSCNAPWREGKRGCINDWCHGSPSNCIYNPYNESTYHCDCDDCTGDYE